MGEEILGFDWHLLSYKPKYLFRVLAAGAGVFGLSLLIWGNRLPRIYANLQSATLGQTFNIVPLFA